MLCQSFKVSKKLYCFNPILDMEFMEIDCPICDDGKLHRAEIIEKKTGTFKRRCAEFEAEIYIVKCVDCKTTGVVRRVPQIGMESYEFPYDL